ncbi:MAG TPA: hypothetical protein VKA14_06165 [Gammaproteobacteria bacterium]|nr:hypothetical protein [Gammaproteobacteria bacterium]
MADQDKADGTSRDDGPPSSRVIEGRTRSGRPCRIVDSTGRADPRDLKELLDDLIREDRFGVQGMSAAGENRITLGAPQFTHIQLGTELYRLIVSRYEARVEPF